MGRLVSLLFIFTFVIGGLWAMAQDKGWYAAACLLLAFMTIVIDGCLRQNVELEI